ncbi:MAG: hypothetical protein WC506_05685 [Candidatus Micrarchaeia archaeon]
MGKQIFIGFGVLLLLLIVLFVIIALLFPDLGLSILKWLAALFSAIQGKAPT